MRDKKKEKKKEENDDSNDENYEYTSRPYLFYICTHVVLSKPTITSLQMHIHEHERMLSFSLRNLSSVNNV